MEYTLENCTIYHDTCFNLEHTSSYKDKGCGNLNGLVNYLTNRELNENDVSIKRDECKPISGAANEKFKKSMGWHDEGIKGVENRLEEKKGKLAKEEVRQMEEFIAFIKKFHLKTLCTCSEDGCNGGNLKEVNLFMPFITAFINSIIFNL